MFGVPAVLRSFVAAMIPRAEFVNSAICWMNGVDGDGAEEDDAGKEDGDGALLLEHVVAAQSVS
jgi:hypothetical protein